LGTGTWHLELNRNRSRHPKLQNDRKFQERPDEKHPYPNCGCGDVRVCRSAGANAGLRTSDVRSYAYNHADLNNDGREDLIFHTQTGYFTTDGGDPGTSSRVYGGPISVPTNLTLKAIAAARYYAQSSVASADYTFDSNYQPDSGLPKPPTSVDLRVGSVKTPGGLKVVDWAGFRAAVTYTFDDAAQADEYPELQATGQRMTFFLTCGWNHDPSLWLQAARDGQEIGNHTQHQCSADGANCGAGPWAVSIEAEYDECTERLKQAYGLDNIWTTAAPYGDTGYDEVAAAQCGYADTAQWG